jgi:hypothetical protein
MRRSFLHLLLWTLVSAGSVMAQDQPPYGPVGLVAISNDSSRDDVVQFGRVLSDVLHKEEKVTVRGDVEFIPSSAANETELLKLASKLSVDWLVVSALQPSDKGEEIVNVEVLHAVSSKVVARATALVGTIRNVGTKVGEETYRTAVHAAHAVTTFVSQFKEVWVILQFLSSPSEANYVFGRSASKVTDKDGVGHWEGTQPAGKTILRVWRAGYSTETVSVDIPAEGSTPYVVPLRVVTLRVTH